MVDRRRLPRREDYITGVLHRPVACFEVFGSDFMDIYALYKKHSANTTGSGHQEPRGALKFDTQSNKPRIDINSPVDGIQDCRWANSHGNPILRHVGA